MLTAAQHQAWIEQGFFVIRGFVAPQVGDDISDRL